MRFMMKPRKKKCLSLNQSMNSEKSEWLIPITDSSRKRGNGSRAREFGCGSNRRAVPRNVKQRDINKLLRREVDTDFTSAAVHRDILA
jgi:hypothetical protein